MAVDEINKLTDFVWDKSVDPTSELFRLKEWKIDVNAALDLLEGCTDIMTEYYSKWTAVKDAIRDNNVLDNEEQVQEAYLKEHDIPGMLADSQSLEVQYRALLKKADLKELAIQNAIDKGRRTASKSGTPSGTAVVSHPPAAPLLAPVSLHTVCFDRFNGTPAAFPAFWEMVQYYIDSSPAPALEKFHCLFRHLNETAKNFVKEYPKTDAGWDLAKQKLQEIFDNKDTAQTQLFKRLQTLKAISKDNIVAGIGEVTQLIKQLESLGTVLGTPVIEFMVMPKLPYSVVTAIDNQKQAAGAAWSKTQLLNVLDQQIAQQLRLQSYGLARLDINAKDKPPHRKKPSALYATSTTNSNYGSRTPLPCLFCCSDKHKSSVCIKYKTVDQRSSRLKSLNRCTRCLMDYTQAHACDKTCKKCSGKHHYLLCRQPKPKKRSLKNRSARVSAAQYAEDSSDHEIGRESPLLHVKPTKVNDDKRSEAPTLNLQTPGDTNPNKITLIVKVKIRNPLTKEEKTVSALLDSGAAVSYLEEEVRQELQLPVRMTSWHQVIGFQGKVSERMQVNQTQLEVGLKDGNWTSIDLRALPRPLGSSNTAWINNKGDVKEGTTTPKLLLGVDYMWTFMPNKLHKVSDKYNAIETRFGKALVPANSDFVQVAPLQEKSEEILSLHQMIQGLYERDQLGLYHKHQEDDTVNEAVRKQFLNDLTIENGRVTVKWPLIQQKLPQLSNNFRVSAKRLEFLLKKLQGKPDLMLKYRNIFEEQHEQGIIEKVSPSSKSGGQTYFMPHQIVVREDKATTKVRPVFDASSKEKGKLSLNEVMHRGPINLPKIANIMMRSRLQPILVTGDIEKAFHQIAIHPTQRNLTSFLLPRDWTQMTTEGNTETWRFKRIPFGVIFSPSCLELTVGVYLAQLSDGEEAVKNLYVDDAVRGYPSPRKAIERTNAMVKKLQEGGFNLRKLCSNNLEVTCGLKIPFESPPTKILGVTWDSMKDTYSIKIPEWKMDPTEPLTKRKAISFLASLYDVLGMLLPITFEAKMFIQRLWCEERTWDEPLSSKHMKTWQEATTKWKGTFSVPRWTTVPNYTSFRIDFFCDASKDAIGIVAYVSTSSSERAESHLLIAKQHLVPKNKKVSKHLTIPRLELTAIVQATRLYKEIACELPPANKVTIFSDSMIALDQIANHHSEKSPIYVYNRCKEINDGRHTFELRHVDGEENPADWVTRAGHSLNELQSDSFWKHGPAWLPRVRDWVSERVLEQLTPQLHASPKEEEDSIVQHKDWAKLLTIAKTVHYVAYIWRRKARNNYANMSKKEQRRFNKDVLSFGSFEVGYEQLLLVFFKDQQRKHVPSNLKWGKLQMYADVNGLVKLHNGLEAPDPIWLPPRTTIAQRIVMHCHQNHGHKGTQDTLAELRTTFWVSYTEVFRTVSRCAHCLLTRARPFAARDQAPLPLERQKFTTTFQFTGLDAAGPFYLKGDQKIYILLFTCATSRAVHLEVATDLSAQTIVQSVKRFYGRRGLPKIIISDNAPSFVAAKKLFDKEAQNINFAFTWNHTTPLAPWTNGWVERLIKVMKDSLSRTLARRRPTFWEFFNLVIACESEINHRPLLQLRDDPASKLLRPVDFLRPSTNHKHMDDDTDYKAWRLDPDYDPDEGKANQRTLKKLRQQHRAEMEALQGFKEVWQKLYLSELVKYRTTRSDRGSIRRTPISGEVVLVGDPDKPRRAWKLATILQLHPTRSDGIARTATVRYADGRTKTRAIVHLHPLELHDHGSS